MNTNQVPPNIYMEQFVPECNALDLWVKIVDSIELQSLFNGSLGKIQQDDEGSLVWKNKLFSKVQGTYRIESCQKGKHLLIDVLAEGFTSILLLTFEENKQGTLFRLDHRAFVGNNNKSFFNSFQKRWTNLFKQFIVK